MLNSTSFQIYNASAGSGKTYTLVKEYLKILLTSNNVFKFQQILAITFTNKAAGEMKERVIENLDQFSKEEINDMLLSICAETNISDTIIFKKSKDILNAILQNYSAFNITTIDSFTHKLIRTFAYDLGLSVTSEVEMDAEGLLNEAVDIVISKIGEDKELTNLLLDFTLQKLDDDKSWDISLDLKKIAKILLNENDANQLKSLKNISINEFNGIKKYLQKENKKIIAEFKLIGEKGLEIIFNEELEFGDFYYALIPKHFQFLATNYKKAKYFDQSKLKERIKEETFYPKSKSNQIKSKIDGIIPNLLNLYFKSEKLFQQKTLNDLILNSLIPLAVLNYINNSLQELKEENNILLNAEFNSIIQETIKNEPAPFIYERIGEKFRYYFIDEMQDTSELQWQNLIPLVENAIISENEFGEKGQLMLVGDAKQSIYRWRGGKAEQFIELSSEKPAYNPFVVEKITKNLDTNYRSCQEIVDFNNKFFTHISKFLSNSNFQNLYKKGNNQNIHNKKGGYVQLSFVENQNDTDDKDLINAKKVLEIIENLDTSFQKNEICVLVRTKVQGIKVANYLTDNGIEIISSETLLLKNNPKVIFIVNLLQFIQNPEDKEVKVKLLYFLHEFYKIKENKHCFLISLIELSIEQFFKALKKYNINFSYNNFIQLPFYESIEYCIRNFYLIQEPDANMQFFLDVVFEFQQKKQAVINEFLEYWEIKQNTLSIVAPEAKNAVRIMTIHKAKGLEFPVVIFPYSIQIYNQIEPKIWYPYKNEEFSNSILVNYSEKLKFIGEKGFELYTTRREELELDNFNILYVALTRAVEQLYIISDNKIKENLNDTSGLFINYLKAANLWDLNTLNYAFGNPKRILNPIQSKTNTVLQTNFISNSWESHNISIVTNSSLLWDTEKGSAIVYGNLIHEMLSKIKTENDILEVVNEYLFKGNIQSNEKKNIIEIIQKVVNHPKLSSFFNQNTTVFTEQEIFTNDKNILIPDRLIIENNEVSILDYKTGSPAKKYHQQINNYARALESLNYKINKKILVYINNEIIIEEV